MPTGTICAVDVGSTSVKAAVYDAELRPLAHAQVGMPVLRDGDRAEAEPEAVWSAFCAAVRDVVVAAGSAPAALAISAQMAGLVLLDRDHHPVGRFILGVDQRGREVDLGTPASRTGCPPGGIYPDRKLAWLTANEPERIRRTRWVGGVKEYLLYRLTGAWLTDPASASATALYDQTACEWWGEAVDRAGIDVAMLPEIVPCTSIAGYTAAAGAACGLTPGVPVRVGTGDGPAANLSSGAVGPDRLALSLGTTVVARLLVAGRQLPAGDIPAFAQHVDGDWFCIGMRLDARTDGAGDGDGDTYSPVGRPDMRLTLSALPGALTASLRPYRPREIRPIGSRCRDSALLKRLAHDWRLPVRATASFDGTRGTALLALQEPAELRPAELSERIAVCAEFEPGTGQGSQPDGGEHDAGRLAERGRG